jgi:hypothetical protein
VSDILCVAWSCWHDRACTGEVSPDLPCDACRTPRQAADGLNLCVWHTRRLADNAVRAGQLHVDLDKLAGSGGQGEPVSGTRTPGLAVNEAAIEARDAIRACLVGFVRLIAEERGMTPPADAAPALALYVARSASWLAAHPAAGEHADELEDIAHDPRTWRIAYPTSGDRRFIGTCPIELDRGSCGTRLHWRRDETLIRCGGCGTEASVDWWQQVIAGTVEGPVDAYAAARELSRLWRMPVDPRTVRQWSWRGTGGLSVLTEPDPVHPGQTRAVRDPQGRALLPFAKVLEVAQRQWGPPAVRATPTPREPVSLTNADQ